MVDLEPTMDETDVIVIDMGSGTTKIGFSGEDAPRACIDTVIGSQLISLDDKKLLGGGSAAASSGGGGMSLDGGEKQKRTLCGMDAYLAEDAELGFPVKRGLIDDVAGVENLLQHAFSKVLGVETDSANVLLLDAPTETKVTREAMGELLFEKFKVKSLAMFNSAVTSLFSTGRTRGLVIESGDGVTHAVPVFEGYAIPHAIFKLECAGTDVTEELYERCLGAGIVPDLSPAQQILLMRKMKEKLCEVVQDLEKACDRPDPSTQEHRSFELPDGQIVQIPHDIRYAAGEVLFASDTEQTIQHICASSLNTLDPDFKSECMQNIVMAGGTSMLTGVPGRIGHEVKKLVGKKVEVLLDSQRKNAAWIGGSMFASFSTFRHYEITKADYEEQGRGDMKTLIARKTY